ncbi:MAG: MOSC domain-containing protein [Blastochloris sp.]|nr:MOSC domain-containing protein [Blastochloris sp.]
MHDGINQVYIVQINVNPQGGVPKYAVPYAEVTVNGVVGDKQRDRRYHGGPMRAVSLFSYERIQALQTEGHSIAPGTTGENLTVSGLPWETLQIGDGLRIGEQVRIVITGYATPCKNIAESFESQAFKRISQKLHPGWSRLYAKVLSEGTVRPDDRVVWEANVKREA